MTSGAGPRPDPAGPPRGSHTSCYGRNASLVTLRRRSGNSHNVPRPAARRTDAWTPDDDSREAVTTRDLNVKHEPSGAMLVYLS